MRLTGMKLVVTLLVLTAVACESGSHPAARGAVSGHYVRVGGPAPGAPVPLTGVVEFIGKAGKTQVPVSPDGAYSVRLPAGSYTVRGTSPQINDGAGFCSRPLTITVTAGAMLTQDVICDIK